MKLTAVDAAHRFDNTSLDNIANNGMARSIYSMYTCPNCGDQIRFERRNFERVIFRKEHEKHGLANITRCTSDSFDAFAKSQLALANSEYLEWICPVCGLGARVYAKFLGGPRHGDYSIDLVTVIEAE